ncbi:ribosomal-protein-alanine N-acetyltransferase [Pedobacter suwonensis]|uniref:Ribosomal-protein-alanine N-acetyltransferase n=1 Tax=Pedobacter suwonensis TaxID=332999 RepID=A0A1I0T5L0_9SPHI|nr:GNAT family N-acetyltransferase [Pedobacter suwonensis]SFA47000.1 ribosomal-protein-alanine N-acetyltransferase [Pedobacter suwonensis]
MKIFAETERLILRVLMPADAAGMFELNSDPDVHRYLGNKPVTLIEQSIAEIEFIRKQYVENGIGRWAVIEKTSGNFLGWSGLKLITETTNNHINYYDLGYRFSKRFWGKGYATETAMAVIDYGFNELKLNEIIGIADINNLGSIHVLEKVGLKRVSVFDYDGTKHVWMKIENQLGLIKR